MLCLAMYPLVVGAGSYVVQRGDTTDNCFIIDTGEVTLDRHDGTTPTELREGFFFGEHALLHGGWECDYSVRAVKTTQLLVLTKHALDAVLEKYPSFAVHVHEKLLKRQAAMAPERVSFLIKKKPKKDGDGEGAAAFSPLQRGIALATVIRFFKSVLARPREERMERRSARPWYRYRTRVAEV